LKPFRSVTAGDAELGYNMLRNSSIESG
jgi:hypothetical protein